MTVLTRVVSTGALVSYVGSDVDDQPVVLSVGHAAATALGSPSQIMITIRPGDRLTHAVDGPVVE